MGITMKRIFALALILFILPIHTFALKSSESIYWNFEEHGSSALDSSDNAIDFLFDGERVPAVRGNGISLNDKITVKGVSAVLNSSYDVTFSAHIKSDLKTFSVIKIPHFNGNSAFEIRVLDNKLCVYASSIEVEGVKNVMFDIPSVDNWTFVSVIVSYGKNRISAYIDDEKIGEAKVNFTSNSLDVRSEVITLGSEGVWLDEVVISPFAEDVNELYNNTKLSPSSSSGRTGSFAEPVAAWDFDETDGDIVYDITGGGADGTLVNTIRDVGAINGGIRFEPSGNGMIDFGYSVSDKLIGGTGISCSAWVSNNDLESPQRIFATFSNNQTGGLHFTIYSDYITVGGRSTYKDSFLSKTFKYTKSAEWVHLVGILDFVDKKIRLYVNGEEVMPNQKDNDALFLADKYEIGTRKFHDGIGGDKSVVNPFNGSIDEVKIYNQPIDAEMVKVLYADKKNVQLTKREKDRVVIGNINDKLSGGVVMFEGSSYVVLQDDVRPVDMLNLEVKPYIKNDTTMVPVRFLSEHLGFNVEYDDETISISNASTTIVMNVGESKYTINGEEKTLLVAPEIINSRTFVPVRVCSEALGKTVTWNDAGLIIIDDESWDSEAELMERLIEYYTDVPYALPSEYHYGTRRVIDYVAPETTIYYGSPSIVKVDDKTILASCDTNGSIYREMTGRYHDTFVYKSVDNGESFEKVGVIEKLYWATLFTLGDDVYCIGVADNKVAISKSEDCGATWTQIVDEKTGVISPSSIIGAHCAPTPVLFANGRIYKAFEDTTTNKWPSSYNAFVMSAPVDSDLLLASSWTTSNKVPFDSTTMPEGVCASNAGWLEGNAVLTPDGEVVNIIRLNFTPSHDYAAILRLGADNKTLTFDASKDYIRFPGGMTKFSIKYDEESEYYISLVNENPHKDYPYSRLILSMAVSKDLVNWKVVETIVTDQTLVNWEDSIVKNGFQYVDFILDGNDIKATVRESWDGAMDWHNANYFTVYTIKDFRKYIK